MVDNGLRTHRNQLNGVYANPMKSLYSKQDKKGTPTFLFFTAIEGKGKNLFVPIGFHGYLRK